MSDVKPAAAGRSAAAERPIHLAAHGIEIDLNPGRGARIDSARFNARDIFYPRSRPGEAKMLDSGSFALVPFSNRIRLGRFDFQGRSYELAPNWQGDRHAIHGEGWNRAWDVVRQSAAEAVLQIEGDGWWPWDYDCVQTVSIGANVIDLSLSLTNRDTASMPGGLGFHPYFPRHRQTRLQFAADRIWTPLNGGPPAARPLEGPDAFHAGRGLRGLDLDHCIQGWPGRARIEQPDLSMAIDIELADNPDFAVLYIPEGGVSFCFEPVSHLTGAFELPGPGTHGLRVLEPGETIAFRMRLSVSDL